MKITDLNPDDEEGIRQAAQILLEGFREIWLHICPDFEAALGEVRKSFLPGRISRIAIEDNLVLGWISAIPEYNGNAWCLYPLAVHTDFRERGVGRALVNDLEILVRQKGAVTLFFGTDDTANMTSLGGVNLYPSVIEHIANVKNLRRHPYEFYQKLGFVIVGVIPDANGIGKPDIFMAKRVADED